MLQGRPRDYVRNYILRSSVLAPARFCRSRAGLKHHSSVRAVCGGFEVPPKQTTSLQPSPNAGISSVQAKNASPSPRSDAHSIAAAVRPFCDDGLRPAGGDGRHSGSTGSLAPVKNVEFEIAAVADGDDAAFFESSLRPVPPSVRRAGAERTTKPQLADTARSPARLWRYSAARSPPVRAGRKRPHGLPCQACEGAP